jgi:hypothetical protein
MIGANWRPRRVRRRLQIKSRNLKAALQAAADAMYRDLTEQKGSSNDVANDCRPMAQDEA